MAFSVYPEEHLKYLKWGSRVSCLNGPLFLIYPIHSITLKMKHASKLALKLPLNTGTLEYRYGAKVVGEK
jgi:hypothetical protein